MNLSPHDDEADLVGGRLAKRVTRECRYSHSSRTRTPRGILVKRSETGAGTSAVAAAVSAATAHGSAAEDARMTLGGDPPEILALPITSFVVPDVVPYGFGRSEG